MHGSKQRALFFSTLGAALLLGLTLQWPSYHGGFRSDDYVQWAMFRGEFPATRSKLDLFSFAAGTSTDKQLVDFGHLPWWSHPELRLRMWRPIASALISLDFTLFGRDARLHHCHSLLWFCLLLLAAGRLLWRILPPPAAAIALCMFASAPCHTVPVGWLANRSTVVACTWAFIALERQLYAREQRRLWPRLACALTSCIALLCGEYALSALVYGLCFSLLLIGTRDTRSHQLRASIDDAMPVLAPVCGYLVLHSIVGSDIIHSGYYISPFSAPGDFIRAAFTRVPVLSADLLFGMPSYYYHGGGSPLRTWLLSLNLVPPDIWVLLPDWTTWHVLIGYLALAFGFGLYAWLRRNNQAQRPPAWLALGTLLSLLPCAGSLPEDRLLTAASLGTCALIASAIVSTARALRQPPRRAATLVLLLLALWVPLSAIARSLEDVRGIRDGSELARAWCLDAEMPETAAESTRVYVVSTAEFNTAVNLPWLRHLEANKPLPLSYRRLIPGPSPVLIQRASDRTLEARVVISDVYGSAVPGLYRDAAAPVQPGERRVLPGLVVTVLEAYADNPVRMRFEFDRSLDDPSMWFIAATDHGLRRISMPPVGESMLVPFAQYRDVRIPAQ